MRGLIDLVKDRVSALEAGKALGLEPDRDGRCRCPFHGGKDRNLKLYDGGRGFYCFVCHERGDALDLVQKMNDMPVREAVQWLSDAFGLGVDTGRHVDTEALKRAAEARKRRDEQRERREQNERELFDLHMDACDLYFKLAQMKEQYEPLPWDETWDNRFAAALRYMPEAYELAVETGMS